jgi:hypothetical protein
MPPPSTTGSSSVPRPMAAELETKPECIKIDDVGYYCITAPSPASTTPETSLGQPTPSGSSVVASKENGSGDTEIFLTKRGKETRITNNAADDMFPAQDPNGSAVVWQTLVEGRWQIMLYDVASGATVPVSREGNNMHAQVAGKYIVWQKWEDTNWEIYLGERQSDSGSVAVQRITANTANDMFPVIADGIVSWQVFENASWHVYAYDITTAEITKLSSEGKNENPRFALVWDARSKDGSRTVYARDLATGETKRLSPEGSSPPTPLPRVPETPLSTSTPVLPQHSTSSSPLPLKDLEPTPDA